VFILGNAATLERSDASWKQIVQDAKSRSCLVETDVTFFTSAGKPSVDSERKPQRQESKTQKAVGKVLDSPGPSVPAAPSGMVALGRKPASQVSAPQPEPQLVSNGAAPLTLEPPPHPGPSGPWLPPNDALKPEPQGRGTAKPKVKKRPKQAPNLFIPPKKRPAPPDSEPGPSGSRRRV